MSTGEEIAMKKRVISSILLSALIVTALTACSSNQGSSSSESQSAAVSSDASVAESGTESSDASTAESSVASSSAEEMSIDDVKAIMREIIPTEFKLQLYSTCQIEYDKDAEPYVIKNEQGNDVHYQPVTEPGLDTIQKMDDLFHSVYTDDYITSFCYTLFEGDYKMYAENDEGKLCVNVDGGGAGSTTWNADTITGLTFDNQGITFEISGLTSYDESIAGYMTITNTENGWRISRIFYY